MTSSKIRNLLEQNLNRVLQLTDLSFRLKFSYMKYLYPEESNKQINKRVFDQAVRRKEDLWKRKIKLQKS